jgi:LSD1 subclass zinc finger protein
MSNFLDENNQHISNELNCKDCGALLHFAPGTQKLACKYCGAQNEIASVSALQEIEEINFNDFIANKITQDEKQTISTVKCNNCGATTTLKPNLTADDCAFCDSPLVIKDGSTSTIIKPKYVLPFQIDDKKAHSIFNDWINGLWFAPNDLKKYASLNEKLKGMYTPYWTFDANTNTQYTGERGEYYYTGEGDKRKRETKWYPVSGIIKINFDDECVLASKSLPNSITQNLEPWNMRKLTAYNEQFISGFQAECYQLDVREGFKVAQQQLNNKVKISVLQDIGGDDQRIHHLNIAYTNVTFKHILLPIWISAYRYNNKVYRFIINGESGKVQGQRPYSAIKIALAVIAVLIIISIIAGISK